MVLVANASAGSSALVSGGGRRAEVPWERRGSREVGEADFGGREYGAGARCPDAANQRYGLAPRVGQRIPFVPPLGTAFVAWAGPLARRAWLDRAGKDSPPGTLAALEATLAQVRAAGYSVGRGRDWHGAPNTVLAKADPTDPADPGHDAIRRLIRSLPPGYESPAVASPEAEVSRRHADELRTLSAPVFGRDGTAVLVLTLIGVHRPLDGGGDDPVAALRAAAASVTTALGGAQPG
jgi:hypothetical protein